MTPVKFSASDVHLWARRLGHLDVVVIASGISAIHYFDFAESRYLLLAAYLFLGRILLAAVNMVVDNRQSTTRSPPPVYALLAIPEWRKPDDLVHVNNVLMSVENAPIIMDRLRSWELPLQELRVDRL